MKKYTFLLCFVFAFVIQPIKVMACSCGSFPPPDMVAGLTQLQPQYNQYNLTPPIIVKGVIESMGYINQYPSADLRITMVLNGELTADTISLIGDSGIDCFFTVNGYYQIGDTIICAAAQSVFDNAYFISICGFFHLQVIGNSVYGGQIGSFTFGGYPYTAFIDTLMQTMTGFTTEISTVANETLLVYPNPMQNLLTIETEGEPSTITFYNMIGQRVFEQMLTERQTKIQITELPEGVYAYTIERKRIIIQKGKLLKRN